MIVVIVRDSRIYEQVARAFADLPPDEWRVIAIASDARGFPPPVNTTCMDINFSHVSRVDRYEPRYSLHHTLYEERVSALHHDVERYENIPSFHWDAIYDGIDRLVRELESNVAADDVVVTWNDRLWYNEVTVSTCVADIVRMERGISNRFVVDRVGLDEGCNEFQRYVWPERSVTADEQVRAREWIDEYFKGKTSLERQPRQASVDSIKERLGPGDRPIVFAPLQVPLDTNVIFRGASNEELLEFVADGDYVAIAKRHPGDKWTRQDWLEGRCAELGVTLVDDHVFSLIHACDCVVTMNSQVGIEAAMHGKPVGMLAGAYWKGTGVTVDHPESVDDVLAHTVDQDLIYEFTDRLILHYLKDSHETALLVKEIDSHDVSHVA